MKKHLCWFLGGLWSFGGLAETAPSFLDGVGAAPDVHLNKGGVRTRSVLFDAKAQVVGFIGAKGYIVDQQGAVKGRIYEDGTVVNEGGDYVGEVNDQGEVINREGTYVGVIQANGAAVGARSAIAGDIVPLDGESNTLKTDVPPSGAPAPSL